jgi:hypothetical protein
VKGRGTGRNVTHGAVPANPFLEPTVGAMLARASRDAGAREAVVAADRRLTYGEFFQEAERFARGLLAVGLGPGDKVQKGKLRELFLAERARARDGGQRGAPASGVPSGDTPRSRPPVELPPGGRVSSGHSARPGGRRGIRAQ